MNHPCAFTPLIKCFLYWLTHHGAGWRVFDDTRGYRQVWLCDLDGLTTGGCGEVLVQLQIWPCHWRSTLTLRASGKPATWVCQQESYLKCKRWDGITKKNKQNSPGRLCVSLVLFEIERMTTLTRTSYHRFCAFYQGGDCTFQMKVLGRCIREDKDLRGGGSSSQGQLSITKTDRKF